MVYWDMIASPLLLLLLLVAYCALQVAFDNKISDFKLFQISDTNSLTPDLLVRKGIVVLHPRAKTRTLMLPWSMRMMYPWITSTPSLEPATEYVTDASWNIFGRRKHSDAQTYLDIAHPTTPLEYVRIRLHRHTAVFVPKGYLVRAPPDCNVLRMYSTPALLFS